MRVFPEVTTVWLEITQAGLFERRGAGGRTVKGGVWGRGGRGAVEREKEEGERAREGDQSRLAGGGDRRLWQNIRSLWLAAEGMGGCGATNAWGSPGV